MTKPELGAKSGPAPTELVINDITVGDGAEATPGAKVEVHYVGVEYETGDEFDSSWNRGQSIEFPLNGLIAGWQEGIPGMKVAAAASSSARRRWRTAPRAPVTSCPARPSFSSSTCWTSSRRKRLARPSAVFGGWGARRAVARPIRPGHRPFPWRRYMPRANSR